MTVPLWDNAIVIAFFCVFFVRKSNILSTGFCSGSSKLSNLKQRPLVFGTIWCRIACCIRSLPPHTQFAGLCGWASLLLLMALGLLICIPAEMQAVQMSSAQISIGLCLKLPGFVSSSCEHSMSKIKYRYGFCVSSAAISLSVVDDGASESDSVSKVCNASLGPLFLKRCSIEFSLRRFTGCMKHGCDDW